MRYWLVALLLPMVLWLPASATSTVGELEFATSFDTLMAQAQASQKVIVLKFFADW